MATFHKILGFQPFNPFKTLSIPNRKSWEAEVLRECSPPAKSQMSPVTCQVPGVRCQVSCVQCLIFIFFWGGGGWGWGCVDKVVELFGGGGVINGAYPYFFKKISSVSENNV